MRFPSPTSARTAVALVASVAAASGCSFITGVPSVDRVEVTVTPRVINVNESATAFGTAFNGDRVVRHNRRQVTFRSSDENVATVNPSSGRIVGLTVGTAVITGESGGRRDTATIIVRLVPANSVVITTRNPRFRVNAINGISAVPRDSIDRPIGGRQILWRSTDEAVLTVVGGIVTPRAVGTASIIATVENGLGGGPAVADTVLATVTVPPITSVRLDPLTASRIVGEVQQYALTLTDSLQTVVSRPVTWESSNDAVATVDGAGLATALQAGTTTISATVDRVPGEPARLLGGATLTVTAPASVATTSAETSKGVRLGGTEIIVIGVRDANGNPIVGRAIRHAVEANGYDPNIVGVAIANNFSEVRLTGRRTGTTTVTLQSRNAANQQDEGTPISIQVTVVP